MQKYRYKVDKLIRDKMPDIMCAHNIVLSARIMEKNEYIIRLKDKLLEEAKEALKTETLEDLKKELADTLEVIHALTDVYDLSFQEIEQIRLKKQSEKGAFEKRIYNAYVEMHADNRAIDYYKKRPNDYPDISDA